MPSIEWNKQKWAKEHNWSGPDKDHGNEWSDSFGSATMHWYAFILPRLFHFLPNAACQNSRILEIAPGHGRWTQFLLNHCQKLIGYDISENSIAYCNDIFRDHVSRGAAEFHVTDGLTLCEENDSVDLVFSFDSLVHVERDVINSYLAHLTKCLKPGAFAFLEHSNLGAYPALCEGYNDLPYNARGTTVSADTVWADAHENGLTTLIQEGLNHETEHMNNELIDCISVIQKPIKQNITKTKPVFLSNSYYPTLGEITRRFARPYESYDVS